MFQTTVPIFFAACVLYTHHLAHSANVTSNSSRPASGGPWTPLKPKHSKLVSISPPDAPRFQAQETVNSNTNQRPNQLPSHGYMPTALASEPRSLQADEMESFPPALIKHRENGGATVGLDLPDSNLRLLLDIDELASKPISENIKFKVVERQANEQQKQKNFNSAHGQPTNVYSTPLVRPQIIPYRSQSHNSINGNAGNGNGNVKQFAVNGNGGYRGGVASQASKPVYQTSLPPGQQGVSKQYKIGYIRASDLHSALNGGGVMTAGSQGSNIFGPRPPAQNGNGHSGNQNQNQNNFKQNLQASSQFQVKYSQPLPGDDKQQLNGNQPSNHVDTFTYSNSGQPQAAAASFSKTNIKPQPSKSPNNYPSSPSQKAKPSKVNSKPKETAQRQEDDNEDQVTERAAIKPRGPTTKPSFSTTVPDDKFTSDEQQKQVDVSDMEDEVELIKNNDDGFGDDMQAELREPTSTPSAVSVTNGHQSASLRKKSDDNKNEVESPFVDDGDFALLRPFPDIVSRQDDTSCPASACQASCGSTTMSFSGDMDALTIREFSQKIGANAIFDMFPDIEDQFQTVVDFATAGYTMFLPSNDAIARLPRSLINKLKSSPEELKKVVENHVSEEKQTMKDIKNTVTMKPRASNARLTVSKQTANTMTVNGQRIKMSNLKGPMGGIVHVLDGLLYPLADKDVMKTLKSCNRFDGFVTLAEGTGIGEKLSSEGPFTVFVPSNEALQKIPDSDLDRIRNNMTSLKEFLMYHVALGSHYSGDLQDGQFITSMMSGQEIQVGVRVDGCSRRLVEANVSPLYRADIPASNGVIHVVDWILKPNDRDWCDGIVLPRR